MVETVGKKLAQARKRKQISLEEAARVTRMRPDKIADLENDNYTNFPNMTYAKGFLLIYAKFLNVDVGDFAETLGTTNPVGIEEYEYLNASERRQPHAVHRASRPTLWPLLMTSMVVFGAICVMYFVLTLKRLGGPESVDSAAAVVAGSPVASASPSVEVRRAEPVPTAAQFSPAPTAPQFALTTPPPAPTLPPPPVPKDVVVKPLKKTWVKIVKDVADSPPIFEDYLYPDARALTFRGVKFWIQSRDKDAIQVTRDGVPVPFEGSQVTIE